MKSKIVATEPLKKQSLEADDAGIVFTESPGFGMGETYHHAFRDVDVIMRSTNNAAQPVLSIQVAQTTYSIRYKANDEQHRALIDYIVQKALESKEAQ